MIFETLPFARDKSSEKNRILMRNSKNQGWTNYMTYPNMKASYNVNL